MLLLLFFVELITLDHVAAQLCGGTTTQKLSSALFRLSGLNLCALWHERGHDGINPLHYASGMFKVYEAVLDIEGRHRWHDVGYEARTLMTQVAAAVEAAEPLRNAEELRERTRLAYDETRDLDVVFSSSSFSVGMTWLDKNTFEYFDFITMKADASRIVYNQKGLWSRYFLTRFPELLPARHNPGRVLASKFVDLAKEQEIPRLIHECMGMLYELRERIHSLHGHVRELEATFEASLAKSKPLCAPWERLGNTQRLSWYDWFWLKFVLGPAPPSCAPSMEIAANQTVLLREEIKRMSQKVTESGKALEEMGQWFEWMEKQVVGSSWIHPSVDVFDAEVTAFLENFKKMEQKHKEKKWDKYNGSPKRLELPAPTPKAAPRPTLDH